jgi:uncharacterized protein (DUF1684 family)
MSTDEFTVRWEDWHREHEERRARPHGFLAITGLHWLSEEPARFDDAPGAWSGDANGVRVDLDEGETLVVEGVRVSGRYDFGAVDERGMAALDGTTLIEVCRRDGQFMIRPRDPDHPNRTGYAGTPTYPASAAWVAEGTFVAYDEPRPVTVGASVDGLTHVFTSSGEIEFELLGTRLRLVAFDEEDSDELSFIFTDLTSGVTTYPACRFLTVDGPREDGRVIMDFNRATNPACAYTDYATCPLPPPGNRLPVRVEAGEKLPLGFHEGPGDRFTRAGT